MAQYVRESAVAAVIMEPIITGGGILMPPENYLCGKNGDTVAGFNNVLTLAPPLTITDDDLEFIAQALRGYFEQL